MEKNKNRRKLNNKGMSLIEILVAIIILAIVSGPLLNALVTSIRLNTKAKENQRMNTMAQSIMEGLKAYDIEQLCRQFNNVDNMRLISGEQMNIGAGLLNQTSWREVGVSDRDGDSIIDPTLSIDPIDKTFLPAPDGKYEFVLTNVKYEGLYGDSFYDIKIDISPKTGWNTDMPGITNKNEYLDAVYRQSMNMDQLIYTQILNTILEEFTKDFNERFVEEDESEEIFDLHDLESMQDTLTVDKIITVEVNEDSGASTVTVKTQYNYSAKYTYTFEDGSTESFEYSSTKYVDESPVPPVGVNDLTTVTKVYDNTSAEVSGEWPELENIYIYYYPAYSISGIKINTETINLVNNTSDDKNFYLVKQKNNNLTDVTISNCEGDYPGKVRVSVSGPITLYHNLQENLITGNSLFTPWVPASASADPSGSDSSGILADDQNVFLLYDIKVSIYEAGAAKDDIFPEDMRLLTLYGSMNN